MGTVALDSSVNYNRKTVKVNFKVTSLTNFNLLGIPAILVLNISVDKLIKRTFKKYKK